MAEINIPEGPLHSDPYNAIRATPGESLSAACRTALLQELAGLELGAHDREVLVWLANWEPSVATVVCSWLRRIRAVPSAASPTVNSEPAPVATAAILRSAAQLIRAKDRALIDITTAVRIAVGSGREAYEQAETVLAWLVKHLEYDDLRDLERWQIRATREQVLAELGRAANAAERASATSAPTVRGGPSDPATDDEFRIEQTDSKEHL